MRFSTTATMLAAGVALALAGCNSDGSSSGTGTLNLAVTDAPVDSAEHVYVTFSAIELKPQSGPAFTIELDEPVQIDLLALEGELSETLLDEETGDPVVPAGDYNWMRLHPQLDEANETAPQHTYIVITEDGNAVPYPLGIPSGEQTGLKLVSGFTVEEDQTAYYVIDFDLRRAITQSNSHYEYKLRPAHRLVRVDNVGAIAGSVDGTLISMHCELDGGQDAEGLAMYLFDGMDAEPHDVNIHDAEKEASLVSTARVRWNEEDGEYRYGFGFLPPADYTLGLTCEGDLDDPEADDEIEFVATENATVIAGETTVVDFLAADEPEDDDNGDNDDLEDDAPEGDDTDGDDPEGDELETQTI